MIFKKEFSKGKVILVKEQRYEYMSMLTVV